MTMFRCDQEGYRVVVVPDGRRGLWARESRERAEDGEGALLRLELAAGREGEDAHASVSVGQTVDARLLHELAEVIGFARWAGEVAADDAWGADGALTKLVMLAKLNYEDAGAVDELALLVRNALRMLRRARSALESV